MTRSSDPSSAVSSTCTGLALALLTAVPLPAAAPTSTSPPEGFETAVVYENGQCALFPGLEIPTDPASPLKAVWSWSDRQPPQKRDPAGSLHSLETAETDWLTIGLVGHGVRNREDHDPIRERGLPEVWVLAGPEELWKDVPEVCLPAWPVNRDRAAVRIPRGGGSAWKLRAIGDGVGSWWTETEAGERTARLRLAPARDLEVQVEHLEGTQARPLSGATLELHRPGAGARGSVEEYWASYIAGEDGVTRVPSLPAAHEILAVANASGFLIETYRGSSEHLPARFVLDPGASLRGRVTDPEGRPLEGVDIAVFAWASPHVDVPLHHRARTNEKGIWELATLPPGETAVSARGKGLTSRTETVTVEEPHTSLPAWVLEPGIELPVRVLDDLGAPVPEAPVYRGRTLVAKTDARGETVIAGVPIGRGLSIEVRARGHQPETATLAPPYPEVVQVQITRGFKVEGAFAAPDGTPIENAKASVRFGGAVSLYEVAPDGGFEVFLPPGEAAELRLSGPTSPEIEVAVEPGQPGEVRDLGVIRAPVGLRVTGRLLDRQNGEPIAGARVWTPRRSDRGEAFAWFQQDLLSAVSDGEGLFELQGSTRAPSTLRLEARGFARRTIEIEPPADEPTVDLGELWMASGAEVVVIGDPEMPRDAVARLDLQGNWLEADMLTATFQDNHAVLSDVPPGRSLLTVVSGRDVLCEHTVEVREETSEPLEVRCQEDDLEVSGRVSVGGEPSGLGQLKWFPQQELGAAVIARKRGPLGLVQEQVLGGGRPDRDIEVDADGRFRSQRLSPGTWEVIWIPDAGAASPPREVRLEADTASLVLAFAASSIRGRVVNEEGEPIAGARVRELSSSAFTVSREDGSFEIAGAPDGLLHLQARSGPLRSPVLEVTNEPSRPPEPVDLVLEDSPGDRLAIHVVGRDGLPAPGAFVFVEPENGTMKLLTSRADGTVETELAPRLSRHVRAAAFAQGIWAFGDWIPGSELAGKHLRLQIEEPGGLRLTSESYSGPVPVASENGWSLSTLMLRIGKRLAVSPSDPLTLSGLPPGPYFVSQPSGEVLQIPVREGRVAEREMQTPSGLGSPSPARR